MKTLFISIIIILSASAILSQDTSYYRITPKIRVVTDSAGNPVTLTPPLHLKPYSRITPASSTITHFHKKGLVEPKKKGRK